MKPIENVILTILAFLSGLLGGYAIRDKGGTPPSEFEHWNDTEVNQLVVEMDKSCFNQFKNNMDKTIFVKLNFKEE